MQYVADLKKKVTVKPVKVKPATQSSSKGGYNAGAKKNLAQR